MEPGLTVMLVLRQCTFVHQGNVESGPLVILVPHVLVVGRSLIAILVLSVIVVERLLTVTSVVLVVECLLTVRLAIFVIAAEHGLTVTNVVHAVE